MRLRSLSARVKLLTESKACFEREDLVELFILAVIDWMKKIPLEILSQEMEGNEPKQGSITLSEAFAFDQRKSSFEFNYLSNPIRQEWPRNLVRTYPIWFDKGVNLSSSRQRECGLSVPRKWGDSPVIFLVVPDHYPISRVNSCDSRGVVFVSHIEWKGSQVHLWLNFRLNICFPSSFASMPALRI